MIAAPGFGSDTGGAGLLPLPDPPDQKWTAVPADRVLAPSVLMFPLTRHSGALPLLAAQDALADAEVSPDPVAAAVSPPDRGAALPDRLAEREVLSDAALLSVAPPATGAPVLLAQTTSPPDAVDQVDLGLDRADRLPPDGEDISFPVPRQTDPRWPSSGMDSPEPGPADSEGDAKKAPVPAADHLSAAQNPQRSENADLPLSGLSGLHVISVDAISSQTLLSRDSGAPVMQPLADRLLPTAQILQSVQHQGEGCTELRLRPEELGNLRMEIRGNDDRITLILCAERADTLDLLRRNADRLVAELQAAGFQTVDLAFGRWSGSGAPPDRDGAVPPVGQAEGDASALPQASLVMPAHGAGLYLRI